MMEKIIPVGSWDFGMEPTSQIKVASTGLRGHDRRALLEKRAADHVFADMLDRLDLSGLSRGDIPIHAIAIGATEAYGPNRNGDGFNEAICMKQAHTFVGRPLSQYKQSEHNGARLYLNHKNKHPPTSYGYVKAAAYNPRMRRIELLMMGNGTKEAAERNGGLVLPDDVLEKLANEQLLPWSMACTTDPDYPILVKDRGYVPINQVKVGDEVWTHCGRWRPVTELRRRQYTGEVFEFQVNGLPLPLELTATHPMWAKKFASTTASAHKVETKRYFADPSAFEAQPADWIEAKDLSVGDRFFVRPLTSYPGYGRIASTDLALLMGYYLAEGSFLYNGEKAAATWFTCNIDDEAVRAIPAILGRLWPDVTVDIVPKENCQVAVSVQVNCTTFSEFLRKQLGRGCRSKLIPPEIFNAQEPVKLAFLSAWLDGDGWLDKKGIHWSTASQNLVLQGRDLLLSLGITASIGKIDHARCETSGYANSGVEYTLNVSHLDGWRFAEFSQKAANFAPPAKDRNKPGCLRRCQDGNYAMRIRDITSRFVSDVTVYNFEVADDESYSAGGLISHNCKIAYDVCSICNNQAPNRDAYCTSDTCIGDDGFQGLGCRYGLTKLAANGRQQYVENPDAMFFDFSKVTRPADRTAYGTRASYLEKAASEACVLGGAELAEQFSRENFPTAGLTLDPSLGVVDRGMKLAAILADMEQKFGQGPTSEDVATSRAFHPSLQPPLDLSGLGGAGAMKMAEGFRALADARVLLSLQDFIKAAAPADVSSDLVADGVASASRRLPGIYRRMLESGDLRSELHKHAAALAAAGQPTAAQRSLAIKLAGSRSCRWEAVQDRICRSALLGYGSPRLAEPCHEKTASDDAGELLARKFALYKLAFLASLPEDHELLLTARLCNLQNYVI